MTESERNAKGAQKGFNRNQEQRESAFCWQFCKTWVQTLRNLTRKIEFHFKSLVLSSQNFKGNWKLQRWLLRAGKSCSKTADFHQCLRSWYSYPLVLLLVLSRMESAFNAWPHFHLDCTRTSPVSHHRWALAGASASLCLTQSCRRQAAPAAVAES